MKLNTGFFMMLLLSHLIVDYVLQSAKIAEAKTKSFKGVKIHEAVVLLGSITVLSIYGWMGCFAALLLAASHFIIDFAKLKTAMYFKSCTLQYFVDLLLHLGAVTALAFLFGGIVAEPAIPISFAGTLNYMIIIVYVATIVSKTVLVDAFNYDSGSKGFFIKHERFFDGFINLITAFSFVNIYTGVVALVVSAGIYYFAGIKYFKYSKAQIACKVLIYLVIGSAFRFLLKY